MFTPVFFGYLWCAVAAIFSAAATFMLKSSSGYSSFTNLHKLSWMAGAACSYGMGFFFYGQALSRLKISIAYPVMTSLTMVVVAAFGITVLGENLSFPKALGMLLLCVSLWLMTK